MPISLVVTGNENIIIIIIINCLRTAYIEFNKEIICMRQTCVVLHMNLSVEHSTMFPWKLFSIDYQLALIFWASFTYSGS